MGRSSAGGSRVVGGVRHEARCLAWAAVHMLTEDPLPDWASGRRVVSVGGQTNRPVDDVGLVTDIGGWVTIQAKKGMRIDRSAGAGLGDALRQLVEIDEVGVPDGAGEALRPLDPDRDLVLILSDDSAPRTVNANLSPVLNRLRVLPRTVPLADAAPTKKQQEAFEVLKDQLSRCWNERWARDMTDAEFRRLTSVLSIHAIRIADDGEDYATILVKLRDLAGDAADAVELWKALLLEGQRLAEERQHVDRHELVKILDAQGIVLRPLARLRRDISRLSALSAANMGLLGDSVSIATPDGPVRLVRPVEPALLTATGNLAVTGSPGSGKTALLHKLAAVAEATHDLVVLRSDDLRSSKAATRAELNLGHDLAEVLAGWTGKRPGLVLIDGIDQARGADAPGWLPQIAAVLSETRWQIVATIRSFDLKHGPRWQKMFAGDPVDPATADPALIGIRHLMVGDLTGAEIAALREASPSMAALLDEAGPRLRELLANPFNLDLAGQLLNESGTDFRQIHSRAELLDQYWHTRIGHGPAALDRTRTLRAIVRGMLAGGRQAVNPVDLPAEATGDAFTALHHNGVLREAPARPGNAMAPTGFAHPVLFDYAVAMLALGDPGRPASLADALDDDPNLAMTVRPSLEYRLAFAWSADQTRRAFWLLALRLANLATGHLLAASEAARVAALQMNDAADVLMLADAATGAATDLAGTWGQAEARYLPFLLAAAVARKPRDGALACIDALTCNLARHAHADDDVSLALLAAQLPVRAASRANDGSATGNATYPWTAAAAIDCLTVALKDLDDPRRAMLADPGGRLLAVAAQRDPNALAEVITAVIAPDALRAWSMNTIRHLTRILPTIASRAPDLAIAIGLAPWQYEETRRTPTPLIDSAILGMSSNLQQDVDGERYTVGTGFARVMQADPVAATELLLRILQLPGMYRLPPIAEWREPPRVRQGTPLAFAGGHQVLLTMTDAFSRELQRLAEASTRTAGDSGDQDGDAGQIITRLVDALHHGEAWKRLLSHAATAPSAALARALLPALSTPSLYADHQTWLEGAHAACRAAPLLMPEELARVRAAVGRITDATISPTRPENREALGQRALAILAALDGATSGQARPTLPPPSTHPLNALPPVRDLSDIPFRAEWGIDMPVPGSIGDLEFRIRERLESPAHTDTAGDASACASLIRLWDELSNFTAAEDLHRTEAADLNVQIAERLADCPDTVPDSPVGIRIIATLLSALPAIIDAPDEGESQEADQSSWASSLTPGWGVTAATRSAQALVRLYRRESWQAAHGQAIRETLDRLLASPDPVYRLIASDALPSLFSEHDLLISELERRLALEADRHVATHLMRLLASFLHRYPLRVDGVLQRLAAMPHWAALSASPAGEQEIGPADQGSIGVQILAVLAAVYDTPHARDVLSTWLTAPVDHPDRATGALHCLSDLLNPADPRQRAAQERLFGLIRVGVAQVRAAYASAAQLPGPAEQQQQATARSAATFAENLARHLCSATGASDVDSPTQAPKMRGDLRRFAVLALPVLEDLSTINAPRVTLNIVQIADRIAPAAPKRTLLIAVSAVTGDQAYWREHLGVDAALQLVHHFAADYREILLGDNEATAAVRRLLESFVRLGWHQAIQLAEELDELFS
jgi:hypothetical protein